MNLYERDRNRKVGTRRKQSDYLFLLQNAQLYDFGPFHINSYRKTQKRNRKVGSVFTIWGPWRPISCFVLPSPTKLLTGSIEKLCGRISSFGPTVKILKLRTGVCNDFAGGARAERNDGVSHLSQAPME